MKAAVTLPLLLALSACHGTVDDPSIPSASDVQRLEDQLSRRPCVGDLGKWERNYRFSRKSGLLSPYSLNPDLDVIEFHLRAVGTIAIRPGRNIMAAGGDWPDSGTIRSIDGRFTLTTGKLALSGCGPG